MLLHGIVTTLYKSSALLKLPQQSASFLHLHPSSRTDRKDSELRTDNGCLSSFSVNNIYFLVAELRVIVILYLWGGQLIAIWIHGGQNVDAGGVDDGLNSLVPQNVLWTQVLGQVDEQLAAQHLVAMHVAHQLDLWLHYSLQTEANMVKAAFKDFWATLGQWKELHTQYWL